ARAEALFTLARAVVRGRGHVGRLDEGVGRSVRGAFPAIRARTLFRGLLLAPRRRAPCRRVAGGDRIGPQAAPGAAERNIARRQDDGRGARRGMEQPRPRRAERPAARPPAVTQPSLPRENARARPGHFSLASLMAITV